VFPANTANTKTTHDTFLGAILLPGRPANLSARCGRGHAVLRGFRDHQPLLASAGRRHPRAGEGRQAGQNCRTNRAGSSSTIGQLKCCHRRCDRRWNCRCALPAPECRHDRSVRPRRKDLAARFLKLKTPPASRSMLTGSSCVEPLPGWLRPSHSDRQLPTRSPVPDSSGKFSPIVMEVRRLSPRNRPQPSHSPCVGPR